MASTPAALAKEKGNKAYGEGNYREAIRHYSDAIKFEPRNHVFYSNRSAAYAGLGEWKQALEDANQCLSLNAAWGRGYFRKGVALIGLRRLDEAKAALTLGIQKEPTNNELRTKLTEVEAELRKLNKFMGPDGRPLQGSALAKAEGNELFQNGQYEKAAELYTRALDLTADVKEKATLYNNRAACWSQYQNWSRMLEDCNLCLELDAKNVKALLRRGIAFEGLEKHRLALADFKSVLELDPACHSASSAIARLSRLV
ncbi:stress-inducible protein STI1 [Pelomyxa schiedti]|nr:stress-inducible protein STI1 [Pelomyxa schiedti]